MADSESTDVSVVLTYNKQLWDAFGLLCNTEFNVNAKLRVFINKDELIFAVPRLVGGKECYAHLRLPHKKGVIDVEVDVDVDVDVDVNFEPLVKEFTCVGFLDFINRANNAMLIFAIPKDRKKLIVSCATDIYDGIFFKPLEVILDDTTDVGFFSGLTDADATVASKLSSACFLNLIRKVLQEDMSSELPVSIFLVGDNLKTDVIIQIDDYNMHNPDLNEYHVQLIWPYWSLFEKLGTLSTNINLGLFVDEYCYFSAKLNQHEGCMCYYIKISNSDP